jgi:hypothetical protein
MLSGLSREHSSNAAIGCCAVAFACACGLIGTAVLEVYPTRVSESQAVCRQTGPTSFQIVDIQDTAKPLVLWNANGEFDRESGLADRKLVIAFVDAVTNSEYRVAKMDLEKASCSISDRARANHHHAKLTYKLEKQP